MGVTTLILCLPAAMLLHEFGHLAAARWCGVGATELGLGLGPRLWGRSFGRVRFSLRALPLGSFVRLSGVELRALPVRQQILVHLAGVIANLAAFILTYGSIFGWVNLLLVVANLLPLYQHDGWKCGLALMRALLRRESRPVEWVYTLSGGVVSVLLLDYLVRRIM